jgi:hypothetical protein
MVVPGLPDRKLRRFSALRSACAVDGRRPLAVASPIFTVLGLIVPPRRTPTGEAAAKCSPR